MADKRLRHRTAGEARKEEQQEQVARQRVSEELARATIERTVGVFLGEFGLQEPSEMDRAILAALTPLELRDFVYSGRDYRTILEAREAVLAGDAGKLAGPSEDCTHAQGPDSTSGAESTGG